MYKNKVSGLIISEAKYLTLDDWEKGFYVLQRNYSSNALIDEDAFSVEYTEPEPLPIKTEDYNYFMQQFIDGNNDCGC